MVMETTMQTVRERSPATDHYGASALVRSWHPKRMANHMSAEFLGKPEGDSFRYVHSDDGYLVAVTFTALPSYPQWMRVRSTNWRCEDEPNGIFDRDECRKFCERLIAAGFVRKVAGG
jgi:hypothetical protein